MLSWFGRATINSDQEVATDADATYIEPPETPAPVFAVRAFKHAIFGTPHPQPSNPDTPAPAKSEAPEKSKTDGFKQSTKTMPVFEPKKDGVPPLDQSPVKPGGILMTPGTVSQRRKTVSFGAQVVDNAGKPSLHTGKSGLPNDFPGKFPSPFTPKASLVEGGAASSRTRLTNALYEARDSANSEHKLKPRSMDDNDITLDMSEPRSESGRYWKEQYTSYSEESEKQVRELVKKQKLAKKFALMKNNEAMELATRLTNERKQHSQKVATLESANKALEAQLVKTMAKKAEAAAEISALKQKLAVFEGGILESQSTAASRKTEKEGTEVESQSHKSIFDPTTSPIRITRLASRKATADTSPTKSRTPRRPRKSENPSPFQPRTELQRSPLKPTQLGLTPRTMTTKENIDPDEDTLDKMLSGDIWEDLEELATPGNLGRLSIPLSTAPLPPPSPTVARSARRLATKSSKPTPKASSASAVDLSKSASKTAPGSILNLDKPTPKASTSIFDISQLATPKPLSTNVLGANKPTLPAKPPANISSVVSRATEPSIHHHHHHTNATGPTAQPSPPLQDNEETNSVDSKDALPEQRKNAARERLRLRKMAAAEASMAVS